MTIRFSVSHRRRAAIGAGLVAAATGVWLWTAAPSADAASSARAPSVPPAPSPPIEDGPPVPLFPPSAPPSAEGLRLHGLLGQGAVLSVSGGRQLFVGLGREIGGLTLRRVRQDHVVLAGDGGEVLLGFDGKAIEQPAALPASGAPGPGPVGPGIRDLRHQQLALRFGLAARRTEGRISGYQIRSGADLPQLRAAGLRPGDVIVAVNGQTFDSDEKVLELPREIAGAYDAEFEFIRNGKRLREKTAINQRQ